MKSLLRVLAAMCAMAAILLISPQAHSQNPSRPQPSATRQAQKPPAPSPSGVLVASVAFADIGFSNGIRLANLGSRREIFVPLPPGARLAATELTLVYDDISAHPARRSVEVLVNDRSVTAIPLDGKSESRTMRIALGRVTARDGFLKISFLYSGAATQDRCIDVRYVGDSLTIRPETSVAIEIDPAGLRDVATVAALMPREVTVLLPGRRLREAELAAALTVSRSLAMTGRRAVFRTGSAEIPDTIDEKGRRHWTRGMVVIGEPEELTGAIAVPFGNDNSPAAAFGVLSVIRVGGLPALLISDAGSVRAARLLGNPLLGAARGLPKASVAAIGAPKLPTDRVTFDQLGLTLSSADVYGRADLGISVDTRALPSGTRPARLLLDVLVAPDGAGEKAVISVFINERLSASAVAASGEPTRIDLPLPEGLIGTVANVRAVVQRRSAQGDCRFEPQGYPAQILGSSTVVLTDAGPPQDFSDLATRWTIGVEVFVPETAANRPTQVLGMLADVIGGLSPETAPVAVSFTKPGAAPSPASPFVAVSDLPPAGASPRVRFDRGRVEVNDRSGRKLLDLGGFTSGAVAQLVSANGHPGIWIKPFASNGALPSPDSLRLERGDVAFVDQSGIALAMSTERDTLIRIAYPDQISWATVAERFRAWIVGALWLFATIAFLFALQRMLRRRPQVADE